MKLGKIVAALGAGAAGYVKGDDMRQRDAREEEDRKLQREERDIRLSAAREAERERRELQHAAAPVALSEGAGGMVLPASMDSRDVGLAENATLPNAGLQPGGFRVGDKTFTDRAQAEVALSAVNSPQARKERQAEVLDQRGKPTEAIALRSAQGKLADDEDKRRRAADEEGYAATARAMVIGDPQRVFETFNAQGKIKLKDVPTVTPRERDIPGIGKITTFDFSGTLVGPDGKERQGTLNSHDYALARKSYDDNLEFMRKGVETDSKVQLRTAQSEAAVSQANAAAARADAAAAKLAAGDKPPAGYRYKPDGTLEPIPGGPAAQKGVGKPLPTKLAGDLREQAGIADSTERFVNTFKPDYAGKTIMGDASNTTKRVLGDDTGQAQWWQDYALHESTVRNKLFGASLTAAEQGQWHKLTVTPRMEPKQVQQNLERRAAIEKVGLERMMRSAGLVYNREQIEAETGRAVPQAGGASGEWTPAKGGKPPSVASKAVPGVAQVTSPADVEKLPSGALFTGPDGKTRRKP
jgi:hypothetical protein